MFIYGTSYEFSTFFLANFFFMGTYVELNG